MLQKILRWLAGLLGQRFLDYAYPDAAKEREDANRHRDEQAERDKASKLNEDAIEEKIKKEEAEIEISQTAVKKVQEEIAAHEAAREIERRRLRDAKSLDDIVN